MQTFFYMFVYRRHPFPHILAIQKDHLPSFNQHQQLRPRLDTAFQKYLFGQTDFSRFVNRHRCHLLHLLIFSTQTYILPAFRWVARRKTGACP